jgi:hypothetical protein
MRVVRSWAVAAIVVAGALELGGCSSSDSSSSRESSSAGGNSGGGSSPRTEQISKSTFRGTWPFTVDSGTLECDPPQSVYFTDSNGNQYGVNGSALDQGAKPVDPIWKKDNSPTGGPRVSIGDVIDAGLKLCGV